MAGTFPERIVGRFGGTRDTLAAVARRCGIEPSEEQLERAVAAQRPDRRRIDDLDELPTLLRHAEAPLR